MRKWLGIIGIIALATGCAPLEPVEPPTPPAGPQLVFQIPLLGEVSKKHFATIALFRDSYTQSRLVLTALERVESANFSMVLPNCLSPVGANAKTTWSASGLEPSEYVWVQEWRQMRTKCVGNGTLLYAISGQHNGDRGSIPFPWLPDAPI